MTDINLRDDSELPGISVRSELERIKKAGGTGVGGTEEREVTMRAELARIAKTGAKGVPTRGTEEAMA